MPDRSIWVCPSRYRRLSTASVARFLATYLVREARAVWGVENNIYQLGHRGYAAVKGGAGNCPYTYMHDLTAGRYRLPWEENVQVTDGTGCGITAPTRVYAPSMPKAAE